ncbi:unnamed protein product [Calypogeia fissa]
MVVAGRHTLDRVLAVGCSLLSKVVPQRAGSLVPSENRRRAKVNFADIGDRIHSFGDITRSEPACPRLWRAPGRLVEYDASSSHQSAPFLFVLSFTVASASLSRPSVRPP